jgi:outer membrane protein W
MEATMKTRTFVQASAIALALLAATTEAAAAQSAVDAELVPFVGGSFFLSDARTPFVISRHEGAQLMVQEGELRNAPAFGFSAGLRFADRFGVEGIFARMPTRWIGAAAVPERRRVADVNSVRYGVNALYHFDAVGRVRPFAGVGVVSETMSYEPSLTWQKESDTAGSVTLGAHVPMSDRLAVRVQALHDVVGGRESAPDPVMLTLGLSYRQQVR